ncbi:hypothetical protein G9A89_022013 [Geosiphon pyriformis]|nr:hypothetical protein G9A89_022013 [Geosiphon pyriformis]
METGESSNSTKRTKNLSVNVRAPPTPKGRGRGRDKLRQNRPANKRRTNKAKKSKEFTKTPGVIIVDDPPASNDSEKLPAEYEEKPREERPYTDFFPDLDLNEPLSLVIIPVKEDSGLEVAEQNTSLPHVDRIELLVSKISESRSIQMTNSLPPAPDFENVVGFSLNQDIETPKETNSLLTSDIKMEETSKESSELVVISLKQPDVADKDVDLMIQERTGIDEISSNIQKLDMNEDKMETINSKSLVKYEGEKDMMEIDKEFIAPKSLSDVDIMQETDISFQDVNLGVKDEIKDTTMIKAAEETTQTLQKKLPKPSFQRSRYNPHDDTYDYKGFSRPEGHYIRYLEPTEMELAERVEYDMDEQDQKWLSMINSERKKEDFGEISENIFEMLMDRLEKEWFDLTKNIPKSTPDKDNIQPEDSACAICDDTECENSNAIVFCDGCNLAVHQDCYGIPYIPEGQWLCRKCMISPENPVSCLFCPNEGGAFKQTNTNHWAHLLCGVWIPECSVSNLVYMEPIDNIKRIPRSRWKLVCYICRQKMGCCIQCENKHCFTAFHVTCARRAKLCMKMKPFNSHHEFTLKAYCDKHTPREYREQVDVSATLAAAQAAFAASSPPTKKRKPIEYYDSDGSEEFIPDEKEDIESDTEEYEEGNRFVTDPNGRKRKAWNNSLESPQPRKSQKYTKGDYARTIQTQESSNSKAARAYNHSYSASAPIAPAIIMQKLVNVFLKQKGIQKKQELVASVCKYWSLKRESRRGAPLLKRLHLEPWTASASAHKQTEAEKAIRFELLRALRKDMEKLRMLADQVQRREKAKLRKTRTQKSYLELVLFPTAEILREALGEIQELDKQEIFAKPVSLDEAPDYLDHIKNPMDFSTIRKKIDGYQYETISEFKADLNLTFTNAMFYNTSNTIYFRTARRIQSQSEEIVMKAEEKFSQIRMNPKTSLPDLELNQEIFTYNLTPLKLPNRVTENIDEKANAQSIHQNVHEIPSTKEAAQTDQEGPSPRRTRSKTAKEKAEEKPKEEKGLELEKESKGEKRLPKGWVYVSDEDEEEPVDPVQIINEEPEEMMLDDTTVSTRTRSRIEGEESAVGESSTVRAPLTRRQARKGSHSVTDSTIDNDAKSEPEEQKFEVDQEATSTKSAKTTTHSTKETLEISFGSLVWAKMQGFPWYPAEVEDPSGPEVTEEIMADRKEADEYLVHFFDEKKGKKGGHGRTWKWVPASKILPIGDEQTDMAKLKDKGMTATMKKEIPLAYEAACTAKGLIPIILEPAKSSKGKAKKH